MDDNMYIVEFQSEWMFIFSIGFYYIYYILKYNFLVV